MEKGKNQRAINSGRTTLLVLAILKAVAGIGVYLLLRSLLGGVSSAAGAAGAEEMSAAREMNDQIMRSIGLICILNFGLPATIFFGLWAWAKTAPYPAALSGLVVYVSLVGISIAMNPAQLTSGLLWIFRIAVITTLAAAAKSAAAENRAKIREQKKAAAARLAAARAAREGAAE